MEVEKSPSLEELNEKLNFLIYYLVLFNSGSTAKTIVTLRKVFKKADVEDIKDEIIELTDVPHKFF